MKRRQSSLPTERLRRSAVSAGGRRQERETGEGVCMFFLFLVCTNFVDGKVSEEREEGEWEKGEGGSRCCVGVGGWVRESYSEQDEKRK